ncbi:MAG: protein kinase [Polyangiales bacterium]
MLPSARRCQRCDAPLDAPANDGSSPELLDVDDLVTTEIDEPETIAKPPAPYASGDRVADRWEVVEAYGSGPLGTVYRARDHHHDGRAVALKVLSPELFASTSERDAFLDAYRALVGRDLPHVAMPIDLGVDPYGILWVASPWIHGISLRSLLRAWRAADRRLERDQVLGVLQGAAAALRELHAAASHGALYPENVAITSDGITLLDPGLAATLLPKRVVERLMHFPDVLPYLAPEFLAGRRANAGADLHALGALAAELLTGDPARSAAPDFVLPDLGAELEDAMRQLVSPQPAHRAAALPLVLERLARVAGEASLPPYAPLPRPAPMVDARTRRVKAVPRRAVEAVARAKRLSKVNLPAEVDEDKIETLPPGGKKPRGGAR